MDCAEQLIKEAEHAKAQIFGLPGRLPETNIFQVAPVSAQEADEDFLLVGSHVEDGIKQKIIGGEYVDFAKLLTCDRLTNVDEHKMELVMKGNQMYWVPAGGQGVAINSFYRWEQAFRVFSNIYATAYPGRSAELIQYNHIISTASMSYVWDNIYVSLRLRVQNAVSAQPCVGKLGISLVLLNFLDCNFRL